MQWRINRSNIFCNKVDRGQETRETRAAPFQLSSQLAGGAWLHSLDTALNKLALTYRNWACTAPEWHSLTLYYCWWYPSGDVEILDRCDPSSFNSAGEGKLHMDAIYFFAPWSITKKDRVTKKRCCIEKYEFLKNDL